jgi:glycosyltransferase involved in cell wall biosynthesis
MKILQLGKAYPPVNLGGIETTIQLINEGLHLENIHCDVLGVNNKFKTVETYLEHGVVYRCALLFKAFSTLFSLSLIVKLFKIHRNYDIIHIHHPDPMSALALWLVNPSSKIILHWHSDILRQKFLLKIFLPLQKWLLNRSDCIITTSPNYAFSSTHLSLFLNKIQIVPIGIDISKLNIDECKVNKILNCYSNKKIILAIGRISYYKGYEYLIDSVSKLNENCVLLIIGGGNDNYINKLLKNIPTEVKSKIILLGRLNDIDRNCYLAACDIFVLSSVYKTEAFGIVQVEAMALKKPVVSTEIPGSGVHWVNLNNISGLTVPIKNSKEIANAINSIIDSPLLHNKLSDGAYQRFQSEFTQNVMVNNLITIYNKILIDNK